MPCVPKMPKSRYPASDLNIILFVFPCCPQKESVCQTQNHPSVPAHQPTACGINLVRCYITRCVRKKIWDLDVKFCVLHALLGFYIWQQPLLVLGPQGSWKFCFVFFPLVFRSLFILPMFSGCLARTQKRNATRHSMFLHGVRHVCYHHWRNIFHINQHLGHFHAAMHHRFFYLLQTSIFYEFPASTFLSSATHPRTCSSASIQHFVFPGWTLTNTCSGVVERVVVDVVVR